MYEDMINIKFCMYKKTIQAIIVIYLTDYVAAIAERRSVKKFFKIITCPTPMISTTHVSNNDQVITRVFNSSARLRPLASLSL